MSLHSTIAPHGVCMGSPCRTLLLSPERCRARNLPRVPEQSATAELFRQRWWQHWRMSLSILSGFKIFQNESKCFKAAWHCLNATLSASFCHRETSMRSGFLDLNVLSIAGKGLVSQFLGQHNVKQSQSKFAIPLLSWPPEVAPGSTR